MATLETLLSYTPTFVQRHYAQQPAPTIEAYEAAMLVVEIVGFSELSERSRLQQDTELDQNLARYFADLLGLLSDHGGEVLKVLHDNLLVVWTVGVSGKNLSVVVRRAAACALHLTTWQTNNLNLNLCLGADELLVATVGGVNEHWEFLAYNNTLQQLYSPTDKINNQVLVLKSAWELLAQHAKGYEFNHNYMLLEKLVRPLKPRHLPSIELAPESEQLLKRYVSPAVLTHLSRSKRWLQCKLSIACINLPQLPYQESDFLWQLQDLVYEFQAIISNHNGSLVELMQQHKGTLLIAIWGLEKDENSELYSMRAATKLHDLLTERQVNYQIGISAGVVICGQRGNTTCRYFELLGQAMQLALALCQLAENKILCSEEIYQATQKLIDYESLSPLTHLSKQPINTYTPLGTEVMLERRDERQLLINQLNLLHQQGQSSVVLIQGESGIGKSCLIEDLLDQATQFYYTPNHKNHLANIVCLTHIAEKNHQYTLYHAWKDIFTQLLNHEFEGINSIKQCSEMLQRVQTIPALAARFPLLNHILPLQLSENRLTEQMQAQVRMDNTHMLAATLLQDMLKHSKNRYVFIFEHVHWLDSNSRLLLQRVIRRVQPLLVILTTDIVDLNFPHPNTTRLHVLKLYGLERQTIDFLLAKRLAVLRLPPELLDFIYAKSDGNPLISYILLQYLLDTAIIRKIETQIQILTPLQEISNNQEFSSANNIINGYIATWPIAAQITFQASSLIGTKVHIRLLEKLYNLTKYEDFNLAIEYLLRAEILDVDRNYLLVNKLQNIVYQQQNYAIFKPQWQRKIALWYEKADIKNYYAILAYHWEHANMPDKAVEYYQQAGIQAFNNNANAETVQFLLQTIELDQQQLEQAPPFKRASWYLLLGTAYLYLGKQGECKFALHKGLQILGFPVPNNSWHLAWRSWRENLTQFLHYNYPNFYFNKRKDDNGYLILAAQFYERVAQLAYVQQNAPLCAYAHVAGLNLLESISTQSKYATLARYYAQMSLVKLLQNKVKNIGYYRDLAINLSKQHNELTTTSWVSLLFGAQDMIHARWEVAEAQITQSLKTAEYLADTRRQIESLYLLSQFYYFRGNLRESIKKAQVIYMLASQRNDIQAQVWGLCQQSLCALQLQDLDSAVHGLKAIQALPNELLLYPEAVQVCGLLSLVYNEQDLSKQAIQMATKTARLIEKITIPSPELMEAYTSVAKVYLMQWEKYLTAQNISATSPPKNRLISSEEEFAFAKLSAKACKNLHKFADIYPIAKPRAYLWQGVLMWRRRKPKPAQRYWQLSVQLATDLDLPQELNLIQQEIHKQTN